jgi:uncharacterized membrane protein
MDNLIINNILVGTLLITLGIIFIFFHEQLKKIDDSINSALLGSMWIGNYSREAYLLMKAVYTFVGVSLVLLGAGVILNFNR